MNLNLWVSCLMVLLMYNTNLSVANRVRGNPVVRTSKGLIRGSIMTTRLGKDIYAFRGVRYAEPPVGELRFKQAVPIKPWSEIRDASQEGPSCVRPVGRNISEDCLALNIYTTQLPTNDGSGNIFESRPVLVFIHPGGWTGDSGQSYIFGPEYLLDQEVVLVTINYRLATLGFISTGDARAPGNLGLKDQVEALRFVKENIESFGGNPNLVTISGDSAGSWSVALHILSPMSQGLFHRAICMSGSPIKPKPLPNNQLEIAKKQAALLNCPFDNLDVMLACLKEKPIEYFAKSESKFKEFHTDPILIWSPVVEPDIPGLERFITGQPADLIRSNKFSHVPLLIGRTTDEYIGLTMRAIEEAKSGNDTILREFDKEWERVAPISLHYERETDRSKSISRELKKFYFNGKPITLENAHNLGLVYGDLIVGFPVHRLATLMAENSREPVYYYEFSYQGRYSYRIWSDSKKPYGVVHEDDLLYLFYISYLVPFFEKDAPEIPTVERLTSMWVNFAKTGYPIPTNNKYVGNINWERLTPRNKKYLQINETLSMKSNLFTERYQFLDKLFPLSPILSCKGLIKC